MLCSVATCTLEDRSSVSNDGLEFRVWFGLLDPALEEHLDFTGVEQGTILFAAEPEQNQHIPFVGALVKVAGEHFAFVTAESGTGPAPAVKSTKERLGMLEQSLLSIQDSLQTLVIANARPPALRKPDARVHFQKAEGKAPSSSSQPSKSRVQKVQGLDDSTVQAALSAGVPVTHLEEMAKILAAKPR